MVNSSRGSGGEGRPTTDLIHICRKRREDPTPELENVEGLTYAWLCLLAPFRREVKADEISKGARALQVSTDDMKKAGLIIRGRTGRVRTYEVKQPGERLESLMEKLHRATPSTTQGALLGGSPLLNSEDVPLVDILHLLSMTCWRRAQMSLSAWTAWSRSFLSVV